MARFESIGPLDDEIAPPRLPHNTSHHISAPIFSSSTCDREAATHLIGVPIFGLDTCDSRAESCDSVGLSATS
jgi:hypothetical protein